MRKHEGCPKNCVTGRPVVYGRDRCNLVSKKFVRWCNGEHTIIEKLCCGECGHKFEFKKEESIPRNKNG